MKDKQQAHFYDLEYTGYSDDLAFYVQYALALDPQKQLLVLELGCGTGRVLLELARAGFGVVGVDESGGMLEVCRAKAQGMGLAERVRMVCSDMRVLDGLEPGSFNMAFCALNTFAYLTSTADQLAMLNVVRPLLVQHGILLLDLTSPLRHLLPPSDGEMLYQGSYPDVESGATLHKFVSGYAEPSTQTHHVRFFYDLEGADGTLRRFTETRTFRWTGRYEMQLLLEKAGYRVEKVYGSYDLDEFGDDSERMIFVART